MAKNKKKQHSITTQITLTIVGLVAGTVLLCWLLNVTLLEGYYTRYKQEVLENGFQQINAASEQGILNTSDYDIDFEKICSNGNLTILIITSDGTVVRSSTNGVENLRMQFMEIIMASVQNDDMHLNESTESKRQLCHGRKRGYQAGIGLSDSLGNPGRW